MDHPYRHRNSRFLPGIIAGIFHRRNDFVFNYSRINAIKTY